MGKEERLGIIKYKISTVRDATIKKLYKKYIKLEKEYGRDYSDMLSMLKEELRYRILRRVNVK